MPVQTIYNEVPPVAQPGHLANMEKSNLISKTVKTAEGIGFGKAVAFGPEDGTVVAVSEEDSRLIGITVREQSVNPATPNKFALNESARIATKGVVYVLAAGDVVRGDAVAVRLSDGGFITTGSATTPSRLLAGAQYDSSGAVGDLVKVRLG